MAKTKDLPHSSLSQEYVVHGMQRPSCIVKEINSYIKNHNCEYMDIDISNLNILDACYVSTMCSTTHFIKYPDGKINWKVSSKLAKEFTKRSNLGNADYIF